MLIENIFIAGLKDIVKTAYDGGENEAHYDWQTAIDMWLAKSHAADGMNPNRVAQQRSDFLQYVQGKKFDKDGEII